MPASRSSQPTRIIEPRSPNAPRAQIPKLDELPLVIETPRLVLRPQREDDADAFFRYTQDPELTKYVTWAWHGTLDEARAWQRDRLAQCATGKRMLWTIEKDGAPIGSMSLREITWLWNSMRVDRADLGFWVGRPLWGQGVITEAASATVRWAFDTLGLHKLTANCFEENAGSRRVLEKLGFRQLCRIEEDAWRDGRWLARLLFERTR